ncbi:MAG: hypothetical protein GF313_14335, partial [Caldithrix sp.]|nr:hypothetical protein [Caldithrix sp.]
EQNNQARSQPKENEQPCSDLSVLTTEEKQVRNDYEYVSKTSIPDERCDNCALWINPQKDAFCGGCQIMKGPIHPAGYCVAWVAMEDG